MSAGRMVGWRALGVVGALLASLSLQGVAAAKGDWSRIDLHGHHLAPGDQVRAEARFLFWSEDLFQGARRGEPFYAYLLGGFDFSTVRRATAGPFTHDWWSLGGARRIRVATIRIDWRPIPSQAEVRFVVPDLEPGTYALMFCDAGCARPLGDIVPARVTVVEDPLLARLARRLGRLEARGWRQVAALQDGRREAREAREEAEAANERLATLRARVSELEARLSDLEQPEGLPWLGTAAWAIAGAVAAIFGARTLGRAKRFRRRISPEGPMQERSTSMPQSL